nr:nonstructural protein NSP1-like [uncultured Mediterranean phage uvMED]|tara:strand:+ start:297 stop:1298 length:1002 start_codon:yes stop_codon:yes gene_type:complete
MSNTNPLLNNDSVQGAAKSIEGLMDTKGVIKKPQKEAAPVEPKEEVEAKAETETEVEQPTETQQEETQEVAVEEEASEDSNAIEEQTTDLHQVTVNGEKIDVDLEELKAGYQKDADYRRKTEELAIEKRELKAEEDRLNKQYSTKMEDLNSLVATLNAEINNDMNSKELDALWEEDPTEAAKVDRRIQKRKNTIQQAQQKLRDHQQAQFQEILREEQKKLHLRHPEIADPIKGTTVKSNIMNYLSSKGFSNEDVARIYDSRYFDVIMDGMNYNKSKSVKPGLVSKKVKPTKFVKSGTKSTKEELNSKSRLNQIKTLKKSGSPKDATDLLLRYL